MEKQLYKQTLSKRRDNKRLIDHLALLAQIIFNFLFYLKYFIGIIPWKINVNPPPP